LLPAMSAAADARLAAVPDKIASMAMCFAHRLEG
jgi:hypothetical protein